MRKIIVLCLILIISIISCSDDVIEKKTAEVKTYGGKIEKGGFQQGAEIIAYGWSPVDGYTGESFTTVTSDNLGSYSIKSSKIKDLLYVKAEGYYFNENNGSISPSTLKLYGIVDSSKGTWNINVVTHIIKDRVVYLLENGSDFDTSLGTAISELFFGLNWSNIDPNLENILTSPEMLFLSAAICKDRSVSEVSDLLTELSSDLVDGIVDLSILDNSFYDVNCETVESNVELLYGFSPDLDVVKDSLISYRGISGPSYYVTLIPDCDFYFFTENKNLFGNNGNGIERLYSEITISRSGESDIVQNFNFNSFFKINDTIYFSTNIDDNEVFFEQSFGVASLCESPPLIPVQSRLSMASDGNFRIVEVSYNGTIYSDIYNETMGGFRREIVINNYFYGINNNYTGAYYVVVDPDVTIHASGLYFWRDDRTSVDLLLESGKMWK